MQVSEGLALEVAELVVVELLLLTGAVPVATADDFEVTLPEATTEDLLEMALPEGTPVETPLEAPVGPAVDCFFDETLPDGDPVPLLFGELFDAVTVLVFLVWAEMCPLATGATIGVVAVEVG